MTGQTVRNRGRLIVLEGLDCVGKTTQAGLLSRYLRNLGLTVVLTREPTNGPVGQKIRQIILRGRQGLTPEVELDLFLTDRRQHVQEVIQPALTAGTIVITDRYYFSTMAYQGALGLDPLEIQRHHADFAPSPDLIIILELPLTEIARRLEQRGLPPSQSFEKIDYLAKVAAIFDQLEAPGLVRIDGLGSELEVQGKILVHVEHVLDLRSTMPKLPDTRRFEES
jgi:dTMP kinase